MTISCPPGGWPGSITDVAGLHLGHFTDARRPTGCSVVIAPQGAVAGVDVRGAAPGTRETDLLAPTNLVERVHAVLLAGGSAWGLDAATGVVAALEERGIGLDIRVGRLPLVPAAVLFDLVLGDARIRPDAAAGHAACDDAFASRSPRQARAHGRRQGNVGAGAGAIVGKMFGIDLAMKGGIGTCSLRVGDVTVGALVACNALGDVIDPSSGRPLAGARHTRNGRQLADTRASLLKGRALKPLLAQSNTTIGIVATNAPLSKVQATRLAQLSHDGLARSINPVHTMSDGDTLFMLSTAPAEPGAPPRQQDMAGMMRLGALVAECTARAVINAVLAAESIRIDGRWFPSATEVLSYR